MAKKDRFLTSIVTGPMPACLKPNTKFCRAMIPTCRNVSLVQLFVCLSRASLGKCSDSSAKWGGKDVHPHHYRRASYPDEEEGAGCHDQRGDEVEPATDARQRKTACQNKSNSVTHVYQNDTMIRDMMSGHSLLDCHVWHTSSAVDPLTG
jgi:hypothetical protein